MSQTELSYEKLEHQLIDELKKHQIGVLATSEGESVTARTVRLIPDGLTIYCFTGIYTRKYKQIAANPNVAISANNLQIEGVAALKGQPFYKDNDRFIEVYKKIDPQAYERSSKRWFSRPDSSVIKITPYKIILYNQGSEVKGSNFSLDILNIPGKVAYRVLDQDINDSAAYRE
jgi:general stress protein 26